jgi:hypothetical protein
MDQEVHDHQHGANEQVVHQEVRQVGLPRPAKDGLRFVQRKQLLDGDEDQRRAEQVEHEPVEAEVGDAVGEIAHGYLVATREDRPSDQEKGVRREPAAASDQQIGEAQTARDDEGREQQLAQHGDVVLGA